MSKRTQSIRSIFSATPEDTLSSDNKQSVPRVTAGAVKSIRDTFSDVERDYQLLREQLSSGAVAIDIDPSLIDPSPFADRFIVEDRGTFEILKQSIAEHGQEVPILVRDHPVTAGRYQSAYGHRRIRALQELNRTVKAYLRPLSDEELVLAQGIENSAREDLSFIERAVFALRMEERGFQRSVVQTALSVDRAEVSKLIAVANAIPDDIIEAIGRAPKIGRFRWQALANLLQDTAALARIRGVIATEDLKTTTSDERFAHLLTAGKAEPDAGKSRSNHLVAHAENGLEIARLTKSTKQCRIQIDRRRDEAFAAFVMAKIPQLYTDYERERSNDE